MRRWTWRRSTVGAPGTLAAVVYMSVSSSLSPLGESDGATVDEEKSSNGSDKRSQEYAHDEADLDVGIFGGVVGELPLVEDALFFLIDGVTRPKRLRP